MFNILRSVLSFAVLLILLFSLVLGDAFLDVLLKSLERGVRQTKQVEFKLLVLLHHLASFLRHLVLHYRNDPFFLLDIQVLHDVVEKLLLYFKVTVF